MPATGDCLQPGSNKARPNIVASIMASIGSNNFRDSTSSTLYALDVTGREITEGLAQVPIFPCPTNRQLVPPPR